jgi:GST-like protein
VLKFYFNGSPNPTKVALLLEETGLPYEARPVDTRKGEQFGPEITGLNPNAKVPVIVDADGTVVFDSNAILLYLAEKTGKFSGPADQRGEMLSWLMFIATGLSPFSGQAVHFRHFTTEQVPYAHKRYQYEAERHYGIVDARLATREFMVAGTYTIVDMALWGWARMVPYILGDGAWDKFPHLKRHHDAIAARPAAQRAGTLKERHPFKTTMDNEARSHMFKHQDLKAA